MHCKRYTLWIGTHDGHKDFCSYEKYTVTFIVTFVQTKHLSCVIALCFILLFAFTFELTFLIGSKLFENTVNRVCGLYYPVSVGKQLTKPVDACC